jgi:hypothetical protein
MGATSNRVDVPVDLSSSILLILHLLSVAYVYICFRWLVVSFMVI